MLENGAANVNRPCRDGSTPSPPATPNVKMALHVDSTRGVLGKMAIKSDRWIREMAQTQEMISPFCEKQVRDGVISYGLSSYGYDLRVADEFKIFTNVNSAVVDPKKFDERSFVSVRADNIMVPPNSFALARSVE